ncbi:GldG family protein [Myxococcota bacterium]|nr:GldG family protein [Myxococcota bacterium]
MTGTALLLAGLGGVALAFGLLTALLAVLQPFSDPIWIVGNLAVGLVLLAASVFMSLETLRERMRSGASRRAGRYGTSAILGAVFTIAILGILAFLSTRHAHRFDVSESKVHTLSDQTKTLLAKLDQDVQITAFFAESEAPPVRDLLDRYAFENPEKVELSFVEPNDAPGMIEELGIGTEELSRGVVRLALASGESTTLTEFTESAVTNALQKLVKSKDKTIYFLTGHNERRIEPGPEDQAQPEIPGHPPAPKSDHATGPDSYGRAADALVNETYQVASLLLATQADVPADAAAVVIAGPTRPFLDGELAALGRYVERGGALFVAVDPRAQTNLYTLLQGFGVLLGDDVVVDRALAIFGQATSPLAQEYDGGHEITRVLREPTLFPMVRSVELDPAVASDFSVLVRTSRDSWAERDLDAWRETGRAELEESDLLGPVPIAVAGTPRVPPSGGVDAPAAPAVPEAEKKPGRLVVFGDSDFATNQYLDDLRNRDLFVNSVNWLAGEVESITLRPNVSRASSFEMTQDQFRFLQFLSLLVVPEAIAVVGVLVWWSRRKVQG